MAGARLPSKLFAAALVAGSAGVAQAQEADWTGFYAGVHADYLWGDLDPDATVGPLTDEDIDGFAGGAQVGFNYQFDHFLVGIEGDIAAADADGTADYLQGAEGITVDLDWLATLRARAGFVFDNLLVYGTGGFAWGGGDGNLIGFNTDDTDMSWSGYTVGAGAEYLLSDRISVKAEYLFVDLGKEDLDTPINGLNGSGLEFSVVRLGVNYNFGMP